MLLVGFKRFIPYHASRFLGFYFGRFRSEVARRNFPLGHEDFVGNLPGEIGL